MKITNRDLRRIVRDAEARGWTCDLTRKGHLKLRHPSGAIVIAAWSPSDHRALKNLEARLRRVERGQAP